MNIKRAIEILNPEHREHYDSIEPVNEACRMGMQALEKQVPKKPKYPRAMYINGHLSDDAIWSCPNCGVGYEVDHEKYPYCCGCGQAIDWSNDDDVS